MIKKIFFVVKTVSILMAFFIALPALAVWSDVPTGVTSAVCPASVPGCNTPLNVSGTTQVKGGGLVVGEFTSGFKKPVATVGTLAASASFNGSYQYRYSVVINGVEFASIASAPVTVASKQVIVSMPGYNLTNNLAPAGATAIKIYRKKSTDASWMLLSSTVPLLNGTFIDTGIVGTVAIIPATAEMTTQISNALFYTGSTPAVGKVLTSDANGFATWQTPASGGGTDGFWSQTGNNIYPTTIGNNVGVGTISPTSKLTIAGDVFANNSTIGGTAVAGLSSGSGETYGAKFSSNKVGAYNKGNIGLYATDMNHATVQSLLNPSRDNRIPATLAASSLQWAGYFDGNVNINGDTTINGILKVCDSAGANCQIIQNSGTSLPVGTSGQTMRHNGTAWIANSKLFNNGTFIGIGTSAPTEELSIYGTDTTVGKFIDIGTNSIRRWKIGATSYVSTSNKYNLLITPKDYQGDLILNEGIYAGNVGIGDPTPTTKLEVAGNVGATAYCDRNGLNCFTPGVTPLGGPNYWTLSSASLYNNSGTNIGIGKTNPAYPLDVNGTAQVTGLRMPTGAAANYVLGTDAAGTASWKSIGSVFTASCPVGQAIRDLNADGSPVCQIVGGGGITKLTAGSGITLTPNNPITTEGIVSADYTKIQARVASICGVNSAIRSIDQNGNVTCQDVTVPATTKTWYPGEHCGLYVDGTVNASGKTAANGKVNCVIGGVSYDPSISCPAGFLRLGGDFSNSNDSISPDRFMYSCVKQ